MNEDSGFEAQADDPKRIVSAGHLGRQIVDFLREDGFKLDEDDWTGALNLIRNQFRLSTEMHLKYVRILDGVAQAMWDYMNKPVVMTDKPESTD